MNPILTLLSPYPYIDLPQSLVEWSGFFVLLCLIASLLWYSRSYNRLAGQRNLLIVLVIATLLTSLLIGLRLPPDMSKPPPEKTADPLGPALMIFAALPWILAGGMLGPAAAAGLALLSGLLQAYWETHNFFLPFEMAVIAILFSLAVRQRYRTTLFSILRSPLAAAGLSLAVFVMIDLIFKPFSVSGALVSRIDYAVSNLSGNTLALGIELLIATLIALALARSLPSARDKTAASNALRWGSAGPLLPSPTERSLRTRLLLNMAPLAFVLILTLIVGDWIVAGRAARDMLQARMQNAAQVAGDNVPYFLEIGQNLTYQLAKDQRLLSPDSDAVLKALAEDINRVPFFTQLTVLDTTGQVVASYPTDYFVGPQAPIEEQTGLQIALKDGVPMQTFTVPPAEQQTTAQASFMATILDESKAVRAVLVARGDLKSNPFTIPILNSLATMKNDEGIGVLLDENQRILVHPNPNLVMTLYPRDLPDHSGMREETGADGTQQLVYYNKVEGRPWWVVVSVPARRSQEIAIDIAAPLLGMIMLLTLLGVVVIQLGLRAVTASLQNLTQDAGRLAQGKLDLPLSVEGYDEVGQLRRAFEQMRASLKARMDELNRLLLVSQGVASSLEISEAVQPVLESALATGASLASVVLTPSVVPELDGDSPAPLRFDLVSGAGAGSEAEARGAAKQRYHELDEQILALTRQQERLVLPNTSRPRLLNFTPGMPRPESLLAIALRHENLYYGALWVAYDHPHTFSEEEVRFLATLGGQAALAAANSRLFLTAEIGRQRLAAILASSPDPMLVTDQRDRLLLANPAAWQALGLGANTDEGQPIEQVLSHSELLDLLRASGDEKQSKEVSLPDGRVYMATATPVLAEGQRVGRVCAMRDVTHFKELDALKSDFVATVSHDLRSPLTLMRGYATMMEMVGQLNEQQVNYVRKIITGVESMSRLVNNLLDLGRIEAGVGLQPEMVQIDDIVDRVVGALQLQAAQKRITLTYEIPPQLPLIEADQSLLQQALQNLIENAIKYTRPDGKVHIKVRLRAHSMAFEVSDTGIGVSPMDLPRLFEKFYRGAQQAAREQRGTGLGLAIVKSIADRHGGQVWAESQLGKGSTFFLVIPLRQPKPEVPEVKA